ncbi:MAG: uracil-DNA glycosylase [Acetobacter sp.]|uniref:uracil-DNA glycosylase n=1 Tax=Acetobacter sp. TaxID=440 RepID=UPI003F8F9A65
MMDGALALLQLYSDWGIDCAVGDQALDQRLAYLSPLPSTRPAQQEPSPARTAGASATSYTPPGTPAAAPVAPARVAKMPSAAVPPLPAESVEQAHAVASAATSLEALRKAMESFEACSLHTTAMHTLFPQGPHGAPLMIIGEAPDADEDRSGHVFSGLGGDLLSQMLTPIGLKREDLLLATAIPWRPPGGRPPAETELRICRPFLERAISLLAPQRLLLCGRLPARILTESHTQMARHVWHPIRVTGLAAPVPALAIRHPMQLQTSPTARKDIWHTLLLVAQTLQQNS